MTGADPVGGRSGPVRTGPGSAARRSEPASVTEAELARPIRTCIGCRRKRPPIELRRLSLRGDELVLDLTGGRGAWVCPDIDCFDAAVRKGGLRKALRGYVSTRSIEDARYAFVQHRSDVGG